MYTNRQLHNPGESRARSAAQLAHAPFSGVSSTNTISHNSRSPKQSSRRHAQPQSPSTAPLRPPRDRGHPAPPALPFSGNPFRYYSDLEQETIEEETAAMASIRRDGGALPQHAPATPRGSTGALYGQPRATQTIPPPPLCTPGSKAPPPPPAYRRNTMAVSTAKQPEVQASFHASFGSLPSPSVQSMYHSMPSSSPCDTPPSSSSSTSGQLSSSTLCSSPAGTLITRSGSGSSSDSGHTSGPAQQTTFYSTAKRSTTLMTIRNNTSPPTVSTRSPTSTMAALTPRNLSSRFGSFKDDHEFAAAVVPRLETTDRMDDDEDNTDDYEDEEECHEYPPVVAFGGAKSLLVKGAPPLSTSGTSARALSQGPAVFNASSGTIASDDGSQGSDDLCCRQRRRPSSSGFAAVNSPRQYPQPPYTSAGATNRRSSGNYYYDYGTGGGYGCLGSGSTTGYKRRQPSRRSRLWRNIVLTMLGTLAVTAAAVLLYREPAYLQDLAYYANSARRETLQIWGRILASTRASQSHAASKSGPDALHRFQDLLKEKEGLIDQLRTEHAAVTKSYEELKTEHQKAISMDDVHKAVEQATARHQGRLEHLQTSLEQMAFHTVQDRYVMLCLSRDLYRTALTNVPFIARLIG
jgi:hypothetical protein